MCNYCECDNADKCSIVGNIPIGFCCPNCVYYEGEKACKRSKEMTQARIGSKEKELETLRKILGVSSNKIKNKDLENFP